MSTRTREVILRCLQFIFLFQIPHFLELNCPDYKVHLLDTCKYPFRIYYCNHTLKTSKYMPEVQKHSEAAVHAHACTLQH